MVRRPACTGTAQERLFRAPLVAATPVRPAGAASRPCVCSRASGAGFALVVTKCCHDPFETLRHAPRSDDRLRAGILLSAVRAASRRRWCRGSDCDGTASSRRRPRRRRHVPPPRWPRPPTSCWRPWSPSGCRGWTACAGACRRALPARHRRCRARRAPAERADGVRSISWPAGAATACRSSMHSGAAVIAASGRLADLSTALAAQHVTDVPVAAPALDRAGAGIGLAAQARARRAPTGWRRWNRDLGTRRAAAASDVARAGAGRTGAARRPRCTSGCRRCIASAATRAPCMRCASSCCEQRTALVATLQEKVAARRRMPATPRCSPCWTRRATVRSCPRNSWAPSKRSHELQVCLTQAAAQLIALQAGEHELAAQLAGMEQKAARWRRWHACPPGCRRTDCTLAALRRAVEHQLTPAQRCARLRPAAPRAQRRLSPRQQRGQPRQRVACIA